MDLCQKIFPALDVVGVQNDDWVNNLVDHELFADLVTPIKSESLKLDNELSKCESEDFSAILDAWDAYIAHEIERTRDAKVNAGVPASTSYCEHVFEPLKRINSSGPPERFCRLRVTSKATTSRMAAHVGGSNFFNAI
jgi:hypothetical protein